MAIIPWIKLIIVLGCSYLVLSWFFYAFIITYNTAPFYPSRSKKLKPAFAKYLRKDAKFVDVGSGDGRMLFLAAKYSNHVTGIEINQILYWLSSLIIFFTRKKYIKVIQGDIFKQDYSHYNVIYMYLLPKTMEKILPVVQKTARKGTIIISNTFVFKSIKPIETIEKTVYIYQL